MTDELREACRRAMHVIKKDGTVLRAGRAALVLLEAIGFSTTAKLLRLPPLIWLVELAYYFVANNRRLVARWLFKTERPIERAGLDHRNQHPS